jgi:hypothetical protein
MREKPSRPERSYTIDEYVEDGLDLTPSTSKVLSTLEQHNYERLVETRALLRRFYALKKQVHAQMMVRREF